MDMTTVLQEVDSWPKQDQMQLVETVWNRLLDAGVEPELTDAQRAELDRRLDALDANPEDVVPWEDVQRFVSRHR